MPDTRNIEVDQSLLNDDSFVLQILRANPLALRLLPELVAREKQGGSGLRFWAQHELRMLRSPGAVPIGSELRLGRGDW